MRNHGKVLSLLMSVCFIAATATAAFAQSGKCSFQKISFPPPATNGQPAALNDLGGIAGTFLDSKRVSHGFLFYQGRLTTFMFPGSSGTTVTDMSRNGIIVGQYFTADGKGHSYPAFMWKNGVFSNIVPPGSIGFVNAAKISNSGVVVGDYQAADTHGEGFALDNGTYTNIDPPAGFEDISIFAGNKFDNILAQATQRTQQGFNTVLLKGFCAAAF